MAASRWFALLALVVACVSPLALAIYPEQTSTHWKVDNIGDVQQAVFHQKHALVVTDTNTLASLNARTGQIVWEHILDRAVSQLALSESTVLTVSEDGIAMLWQVLDGGLLWSAALAESAPGGESAVKGAVVCEGTAGEDVVVAIGSTVFGLREGEVKWNWRPESDQDELITVTSPDARTPLALVRSGADSSFATTDLSHMWRASKAAHRREAEGSDDDHDAVFVDSGVDTDGVPPQGRPHYSDFAVTADHRFVVRAVQGRVEVTPLASGSAPMLFAPLDIEECALSADERLTVAPVAMTSAFVLVTPGKPSPSLALALSLSHASQLLLTGWFVLGAGASYVVRITDDGRLVASAPLAAPLTTPHATAPAVARTRVHTKFYAISTQDGEGTKLSVVTDSGRTDGRVSGHVNRVFVQEQLKKDGSRGIRVLVTTTDGVLSALSGTPSSDLSLLWARDEALAHVLASSVVYARAAAQTADNEDDSHAVFHPPSFADNVLRLANAATNKAASLFEQTPGRVVRFMNELEDRIGRVAVEGPSVLASLLHTPEHAPVPGTAVVLTANGVVYGLDLHNGQVRFRLGPRTLSPTGGAVREGKLLTARKVGIFAGRMVAVFGQEDGTSLVWFDPLDGARVREERVSGRVVDVVPLPVLDHHSSHLIGVVNDNFKLTTFGLDGETNEDLPPLHHHLVQALDQRVVGLQSSPGNARQLRAAWQVAFPSDQRVVAVHQRRKDLKAASATHVTGERRVLHKYINPHMVAVATLEEPKTSVGHESVYLYLIDTISGRVVHHSHHTGCAAPVHVAIAENSVFLSARNVKAAQHQLVAIDLFEKRADDGLLDVILGTLPVPTGFHNHTHYRSSLREAPEAISRQYFLQQPVTTLGVTETGQGITSKQLLVGFASGQVLALDRRFINPRQPEGTPTPEEREEPLLPYTMVLPLNTLSMVTYNHTVDGLHAIVTEPGEYESSSLMLCVGRDLLFVPLTPSGGFDRLSEDFNQGALLLALLVLFVLLVGASAAGRRKELRKKWR